LASAGAAVVSGPAATVVSGPGATVVSGPGVTVAVSAPSVAGVSEPPHEARATIAKIAKNFFILLGFLNVKIE
jgi:hypothetical protein